MVGPAVKVKEIRAEALVSEVVVVADAVVVQGSLHKQIFWVATDGTVHHTPETAPFAQMIPVPGARPGMPAQVQAAVEHVSFLLSPDGSAVFVKVLVRSSAIVAEEAILGLALGMGPLVRLEELIGREDANQTVASAHALDTPAVKLSEIRAGVEAVTTLVETDAATVTGLLHYQVFYVGSDGRQRHQSLQTPFEIPVPVAGARPGDHGKASVQVVNIEPRLVDPSALEIAALLSASVVVTRLRTEAVALGEGPTLKLARFVGEAPLLLSDTVDVTLSRPQLTVTGVTTGIGPVTARVHPDQVFISGTLTHRVEYVDAETGEMRSDPFSNPFSTAADMPGAARGMQASVQLDVTGTVFEVTGARSVRVTSTLSGNVVVTEPILVATQAGTDVTVLAEAVMGSGTGQVLIEQRVPLIPVAPEVLRRIIRVEELVPVQVQSLVQALVPLARPAIKIKEVRGEARLVGVEQFGPRAVVARGLLHLEIFVVGEDNIVWHVSFEKPFQMLVPLEGPPGPDLRLELRIERILPRLVQQGSAVSVVSVLRLSGGVASARQVPVVRDILGADVQIDRVLARVDLVQAEASLRHGVTGRVHLEPPASTAHPVEAQAQPVGFTGRAGDNQVLVIGTARVTLSYTGIDLAPHRATADLPVEFAASLPGVRPGMTTYLTPTIAGVQATLVDAGAFSEVVMDVVVLVKVTQQVVLDLITDVRGPAVVSVERQTILVDVIDDGIPHPVPVTVVTNVVLR